MCWDVVENVESVERVEGVEGVEKSKGATLSPCGFDHAHLPDAPARDVKWFVVQIRMQQDGPFRAV